MTPDMAVFWRLLASRPHRALAAAFWYATGRKTRARNRLRKAAREAFSYATLIRLSEQEKAIIAAAPRTIAEWTAPPLFSLIMASPSGREGSDATIRSIQRQCYDRWELLWTGGPPPASLSGANVPVHMVPPHPSDSPMAAACRHARGQFVVPLAEGATLSPTALFRFAEAVQARPDAVLLYGDEDSIDSRGVRHAPWLKPEWNAEMVLALDYVSRACAVRTDLARHAGAAIMTPYELVLQATRGDIMVAHVPHIIVHLSETARRDDQAARVRAVGAHVAAARAAAAPGPFGTVTVRWPAPDPEPSVTILIPTRDKVKLLEACVESLVAKTAYRNYRVHIVDNGSTEPATLRYFAHAASYRQVDILPCEMPYNFSAINNFAVARTQGPYLCFLNNDTEIIAGDWLGEMMRYAARPGIGAVGAKLLYADHSIQHAGVVIGLGSAAGHAHRGLPGGEAGYFAQAHAAHYATAVTAACLLVERSKFDAVGGFDAVELPVAYNDVDLCLKLQERGWRNVYAPQATLLHLESKSRGSDLSSANIARYKRELAVLRSRWATDKMVDPMHHAALDRSSETYRPSFFAES